MTSERFKRSNRRHLDGKGSSGKFSIRLFTFYPRCFSMLIELGGLLLAFRFFLLGSKHFFFCSQALLDEFVVAKEELAEGQW